MTRIFNRARFQKISRLRPTASFGGHRFMRASHAEGDLRAISAYFDETQRKRWFAHISESFRCRYAVALKYCKFNLICMPLLQLLYFGRSVHFSKVKMIKQKKAFQHLATRHNKQTFMKMFR